MEYTPRGRVPVSEPISPVAQRVALSGPASEPGGAGVASSREGWPWQFQLNPRRSEERPLTATRKASPVATQLRALSGGRGQVVNATARASYETAVIAAVRRQCDIFEEKWEKKLRQDRKDSTTGPSLDRLFDRVNALEAQQPRVEKRLAELDGKVKGLSDELQAQIRQVHLLDDRRWEWKQKLEEELANKCQALQQQMQALLSSSRTLSLEEESKQQRSWNTALEDGLKAAARERLAMQEEVHEGFVNVCERLAALEVQQIQEPFVRTKVDLESRNALDE
ncbi:Zeaxanthin epoxidase [Durusdinium trenchii]|uniref:Chloroplastic n=1 Tax=Durusdinium trenchii TaxID=1381693 RepID=A0ABP0S6Y8_9DINO